MIRTPRLPPATFIDQRSLYTRSDMVEFYRLGFMDGRDSEESDMQPASDPFKPSKPVSRGVKELMDIFGMKS